MKKKNQILKLLSSINPKTGKPYSKLGISKKVGVSRTYIYKILKQAWKDQSI